MIKILITVIYLSNPFMRSDLDESWKDFHRSIGIEIVTKKTIRRENFEQRLYNLGNWTKRHARVKAWIKRQRIKGPVLVIDPPILDNNIRYIAGLSNKCTPNDGVAVVFAQDFNSFGEDRREAVRVTAAHEFGHIFGAADITQEIDLSWYGQVTLMNEAAAAPYRIHPGIKFAEKSISEIRDCLRWKGVGHLRRNNP